MIQKTRYALVYMLGNPMYIIIHFGCWFLLFVVLTLPFQSNNHLQSLLEGIPIICVMAFISISLVLGVLGIVDNPNFFLRYLCIALFIVI